jgi:hypothetical protein
MRRGPGGCMHPPAGARMRAPDTFGFRIAEGPAS